MYTLSGTEVCTKSPQIVVNRSAWQHKVGHKGFVLLVSESVCVLSGLTELENYLLSAFAHGSTLETVLVSTTLNRCICASVAELETQ